MAASLLDLQNARRFECEIDRLYFARYFFKLREAAKFIVNPHHQLIADTLDRVYSGELNRLIITMPPGYTKTELAVINFIAGGLAANNRSRFLHLSYSDKLAGLNSAAIRNIVRSDEYQAMWPMTPRDDSNAKSLWWNEYGGGVYATSIGGQVTGFRAGHMQEGFTGALIVDDPLKPKDALFQKLREGINDDFNETIKSRLAVESVPIIVIMQRVHYNDLVGYLLRGGSGEIWDHLDLPVMIDHEPYPEEYTHGRRIEHDLPEGWLWPLKHNDEHEVALRAHRRSFETQYMQRPRRFNAEGALWTEIMIGRAQTMEQPWKVKRTVVAVDPAVSNDPTSDDTGIITACSYTDGKYSVRRDNTKNTTTDAWCNAAIKAYDDNNADAIVVEVNNGGDLVENVLRLKVKPDGTKAFTGRVIAVHAAQGKFARAEPISALYEQGLVHHAAGLYDYEEELLEYIPSESRKSPNRLDAGVWALTELSNPQKLAGVWGR